MELDEHDLKGGEAAGAIRDFGADSLFPDWMLHVKTPVGEPCHLCQVQITALDVGHTMIRVSETTTRVAVHRECFLRSIMPDKASGQFPS